VQLHQALGGCFDAAPGKPEGVHLMIGRRPFVAFGNSDGDQEMLEYTKAGDGARLALIVLHDDARRECAYGPARALPATKVGAFTQALFDQATKQDWVVPLGGGVGKIFHFGKLPVNTQLSAHYNVVKPDFGADWQIRAQVQLMFPK
jgi:hypothetical protein